MFTNSYTAKNYQLKTQLTQVIPFLRLYIFILYIHFVCGNAIVQHIWHPTVKIIFHWKLSKEFRKPNPKAYCFLYLNLCPCFKILYTNWRGFCWNVFKELKPETANPKH